MTAEPSDSPMLAPGRESMTERVSFHARVMALHDEAKPHAGMGQFAYGYVNGHRAARDAAAAIASEADALAEAAQGLRVALEEARGFLIVAWSAPDVEKRIDAALAAYAKAAGESA